MCVWELTERSILGHDSRSTSPAITAEMMGKGVGVPPWERIRLYMPRAVLEESSGLRVALVLEVDADEGYWQHFTTRHDAERYMVTKDSLEQALAKDFTNHASVKDALRKGGAGTGSAPHGYVSDCLLYRRRSSTYRNATTPCGECDVYMFSTHTGRATGAPWVVRVGPPLEHQREPTET